MKQYLNLCNRIVDEGIWVDNKRTGTKCLTVINADLEYKAGEFPLVTTRKSFYKSAIAEMLGYLRGYTNAQDFADIGAKTWLANANENEAWLKNPIRNGNGDMGKAYRYRENTYHVPFGAYMDEVSVDQLRVVIDKLTNGVDDRRLIIDLHNPHLKDYTCLDACMYNHQFSLLGDTLHLNSTQRSCDVLLGLNFNMVQVYFLLAIVAQITGYKQGTAHHKIVNAHIYEDQLDIYKTTQAHREPLSNATFHINPNIKSLEDLETWVTVDDFWVEGYEHHDAIKYPFTV